MAGHSRLHFFSYLKHEIEDIDYKMLKFLVGLDAVEPSIRPDHSYFNGRKVISPLGKGALGFFADGDVLCKYWETYPSGEPNRGINLMLPCIKDPHQFEFLELLDWVASLSIENGLVGTMVDDYIGAPAIFLYIFDGKLFFGYDEKQEIVCLSTSEERLVHRS